MAETPLPPKPNQQPSTTPNTVQGASTPVSGEAGKGVVDPKKSRMTLFITFIGVFVFLFVLFLVFLVVMLLQSGNQNPILGALGVEAAYLQQLLSLLVNLVFGFLAMVSFIVTLVGLFRRLTSAPAELQKKKQSLIMAIVSGLLFLFVVAMWLGLYFYLSQLQVGSVGAKVILSQPEQTTNLTAPVAITFTAREVEALYIREGIVSYAWDLDGDGQYDDGNGRDIQYTYVDRGNAEGTYMIGLKVILSDGREDFAQKLVSIANVKPTISVGYSPKTLEVPLDVSFDASASKDPDGSIISFDWDFDGDGTVDAQGAKVTHRFTEPLDQEVRLAVTDNNGLISEERIVLAFSLAQEKQAVIVARPSESGTVPFRVTFDASESKVGEQIQAYDWDFGDGTASGSGRTIQHVYSKGGTFMVRLSVTTDSGKQYSSEKSILVKAVQQAPLPRIEAKGFEVQDGVLKGNAPFSVVLNAAGSRDPDGTIIEYRWDLDGDGVDDAFGDQVEYTYAEKGNYSLRLAVVDNDNLEAVEIVTVQVIIPDVQVDLQISQPSGPTPLEVTFDASGSRSQAGKIISYTWDFGDGTPKVIGSARQTHVFTAVGEYTATVTVLTDQNVKASEDILIVVREVELQADFTINPQVLEAGRKAFFSAESSQGQINRYYWDFGDGEISRIVKPEHIFEVPGTYTVQLEIYDRKNRVSRKQVDVEVLPAP